MMVTGVHPARLVAGHRCSPGLIWLSLEGDCTEEGTVLFSQVKRNRRGNGLKLHYGRFRLDIRRYFFTERGFRLWTRLLRKVEESPSLEVLNKYMDMALGGTV